MIKTLSRSLLASWGAAKGDAFHAVGATLLGSMTFAAEVCRRFQLSQTRP
jgi:hypothetical protein